MHHNTIIIIYKIDKINMKRPYKLLFTLSVIFLIYVESSAQEIKSERLFEGKGLYGYMNGGSDLYYEYNFIKLTVKEIAYEGHKYTMEIYSMDCPKNAYGLYSIHIFKPLRIDTLIAGGFDCLSQYELQAAAGDEYISIVFTEGLPAAKGADSLLLKYLKSKQNNLQKETDYSSTKKELLTAENSLFPPEIRTLSKPFSGRLKYARGPLALSNIDEESADKYPDIGTSYGIWIYSEQGKEDILIKENF